jgi:uncharacterized protein YlxW (UPF0749 family)
MTRPVNTQREPSVFMLASGWPTTTFAARLSNVRQEKRREEKRREEKRREEKRREEKRREEKKREEKRKRMHSLPSALLHFS